MAKQKDFESLATEGATYEELKIFVMESQKINDLKALRDYINSNREKLKEKLPEGYGNQINYLKECALLEFVGLKGFYTHKGGEKKCEFDIKGKSLLVHSGFPGDEAFCKETGYELVLADNGNSANIYFGYHEAKEDTGKWKSENSYTDKKISELKEKIREVFELDRFEEKIMNLIDNGCRAIICHGAPGTGKTHTVCKVAEKYSKKIVSDNTKGENTEGETLNFIQFHPSYDYTDFIEGLRPVIVKTDGKLETTFVRLDGTFKKFCRWVAKNNNSNKDNQEQTYLFIIDEINRADLAKVFGEVMFNIEEGWRGEKHTIKTQYDNLPTYEVKKTESECIAEQMDDDIFKGGFYIPENVVVIGTMNDVDRSVDSIDFAMRRRFKFIEVDADDEMPALKNCWEKVRKESNKGIDETEIVSVYAELNDYINQLNKKIKDDLGSAYKIGHAYFKDFYEDYNKIKATSNQEGESKEAAFNKAKENVWKYSLKPLINEYLRGKKGVELDDYEEAFNILKKEKDSSELQ